MANRVYYLGMDGAGIKWNGKCCSRLAIIEDSVDRIIIEQTEDYLIEHPARDHKNPNKPDHVYSNKGQRWEIMNPDYQGKTLAEIIGNKPDDFITSMLQDPDDDMTFCRGYIWFREE